MESGGELSVIDFFAFLWLVTPEENFAGSSPARFATAYSDRACVGSRFPVGDGNTNWQVDRRVVLPKFSDAFRRSGDLALLAALGIESEFWLGGYAHGLQLKIDVAPDRIFPPEPGATSGRQRVEGSFEDLLERAAIKDFRFHDLRHTFASWFMMNGGDLYELAKILGHSNIKMTERYAKLARQHIARTGSTAREIWKLMEHQNCNKTNAG